MDDLKKVTIEELINGYIDGELGERHKTELKRLMLHDPELVERIDSMVRQKKLFEALPVEKAPAHMLDDIKARVERKALLNDYVAVSNQTSGSKHLFLRHLASSAAVIALLIGLTYVILQVVLPAKDQGGAAPVIVQNFKTQFQMPEVVDKETAVADMQSDTFVESEFEETSVPAFYFYDLEIQVKNVVNFNRQVSQAIYNNSLLDHASVERLGGEVVYELYAPRENFVAFLKDLKTSLDNANEVLLTISEDESVMVQARTAAEELVDIFASNGHKQRIELAKDFNLLNKIYAMMPAWDIVKSVEENQFEVPTVPKPVLASPRALSKDSAGEMNLQDDSTEENNKINLRIFLREVK